MAKGEGIWKAEIIQTYHTPVAIRGCKQMDVLLWLEIPLSVKESPVQSSHLAFAIHVPGAGGSGLSGAQGTTPHYFPATATTPKHKNNGTFKEHPATRK